MKNQYRSSRWITFREELIELDGQACVKCGRCREDGIVLQVHHKKYLPGKAPWEYPLDLCETLCKRCHAVEHGEISPATGWEYVGADDLGGLNGTCDLCHTEIRHVFYVQHPGWEPMAVGTYCCDMLTGTTLATESRRFDDRLKRFAKSTRWKDNGGTLSITQKGIEILIAPANGGFRIQMKDVKGKTDYPDIAAAKGKAFAFVESGAADNYFKKK